MEIDITNELIAFEKHLKNNERVILSAKFGDGKTYFLDAFKKKYSAAKENDQQQYEFITLYPINYQVSDNKEIFEYIKRDILIQLILKEMIEPNCQISEAQYLQHYIMNNHLTLAQDIIQTLPSLGIGNEGFVWAGLMGGIKGLFFLKTQKEKYKKFKEDIEAMDDIALAEAFCNDFSKEKGGCYELDLITEIIIQSIQKYKEEHNKKVVLIIEDMDRLDPAHLFRLLNIFSAHLDRYNIYKNTSELANYTLSNKFGFDNVITVFDYDNTKEIFAHFYGDNTNFEGYINKFISGNVFHYSINDVAKEYLSKLLKNECGVEFSDFKEKYLISEVCKKIYQVYQVLSVRDIEKILSKYNENFSSDVYKFRTGIQIQKANTLTKLISILRLMGFEVEEIKRGILSLPDEVKLNCMGCYLLDMFEIINSPFIYNGSYYSLKSNINCDPINSVEFIKHSDPIIGAMKVDRGNIDRSINKAFEHV